MRYMCLGCGRYWHSSLNPIRCPYCSDSFFLDNIHDDIPPPLSKGEVKFKCGHSLESDTAHDVAHCCCCMINSIDKVTIEAGAQFTSLQEWQNAQLERIGV